MAIKVSDPIPAEDRLDAAPLDKFENLGNGIYLVPREHIVLAEQIVPKDGKVKPGEFAFENPRLGLGFHDFFKAEGMEKESIDEIRESIKQDGLDHPLLCRVKNDKIQVVNGMRRLLQIDHFIRTNANVKDKSTGEMVSAKALFMEGGIPCRIEEMSDLEAYRRANSTDDTSKPHGDAARLAQIRYFAQAGRSEHDIMLVCGKSKEWVARMLPVALGLDKDTFSAFAKGAIAFPVAEYLSQYEDVEKRKEVLESLLKKGKERADAMIAEAESHLKATAGKVVKAKAQLAAAKRKGEPEKLAEAEENLAEAEKKHEAAKEQTRTIKRKKTPQITRRDLPRASNPRAGASRKGSKSQNDNVRNSQPDGIVKRLSGAKQTKKWYEPACEAVRILKKGDPDGEVSDKIHPEFWYLIKLLHEKADAGEENIEKIGELWSKQAERRGSLSVGNVKKPIKKKSASKD